MSDGINKTRLCKRFRDLFFVCYGAALVVITFFFLIEDRLFEAGFRMENYEEVVVALVMFIATITMGLAGFVIFVFENLDEHKNLDNDE